MEEPHPPLDLTRPRELGDLLSTAVQLFARHSGLFLSVTLLVVAPVVVFVDGVWGGALRDGSDFDASTAAVAVSSLLTAFAVPSLVTAMHAVIVRDIGNGRGVPGVGRALREAAPRMPAAIGAVVLYTVALAVGLMLLIIPGIWIAVHWCFAAQAAVLEEKPPSKALERSGELVAGRWWQTFGALLLSGILFGASGAIAAAAAGLVDEPVVYVVLLTIVRAVTLSLSALFGTLLFFSMRARQQEARATELWAQERAI